MSDQTPDETVIDDPGVDRIEAEEAEMAEYNDGIALEHRETIEKLNKLPEGLTDQDGNPVTTTQELRVADVVTNAEGKLVKNRDGDTDAEAQRLATGGLISPDAPPIVLHNDSIITPEQEKAIDSHIQTDDSGSQVTAAEDDLPMADHQIVQQSVPGSYPVGPKGTNDDAPETVFEVALPNVLSDMFGVSASTAAMMLRDGKVTIDDEEYDVPRNGVVPIEDVEGKAVKVEGDFRTVSFTYKS